MKMVMHVCGLPQEGPSENGHRTAIARLSMVPTAEPVDLTVHADTAGEEAVNRLLALEAGANVLIEGDYDAGTWTNVTFQQLLGN